MTMWNQREFLHDGCADLGWADLFEFLQPATNEANAMFEAPRVRQDFWLGRSRLHMQQARRCAVHAYVECFSATTHGEDKEITKRTRMAVREEVLKLANADLNKPNRLDAMLKDEVKAHGLPKSIEGDLLSQLSNGQKKMCEEKLQSYINSPVFDNLVEHKLPAYLKAVQEEPTKFADASAEIIRKLRQAPSFLTETITKAEQDDRETACDNASFVEDVTPPSPPSDLCSPTIHKEQNINSEDAFVSSQDWQVKNTFIEFPGEMRKDPAPRHAKSCLAGCWSHHAEQKGFLPGRAGSVGEVASHWEAQSVSKWDYGGWTDIQRGLQQAACDKAAMSPALLNMLIDALSAPGQNAAELALYISANVHALDANMKTKAIDNFKLHVNAGVDCEAVLNALAACTKLQFLDHAMVHDSSSTQYKEIVASIFSRQLSVELLSEKQLPKLMEIVLLHWPLQDKVASIIVDSCITKMLEVYQDRGVILGVSVSTGQAARLINEDHVGIANLLQECGTPKHWNSCAKLIVRMYPLPKVVELLLASDHLGDACALALEEIIGGFDPVASILLDTDDKHTERERNSARKIISEALLGASFPTHGVDNWTRNNVKPFSRFEMRKRFFVFSVLLGEADLWQLIEGSILESYSPQEDMLSAALSIIQDLVPFRNNSGVKNVEGTTQSVASKRVDILLKIDSQQYRHAFDSNLAQCLGVLVNDLDFGETSEGLSSRICEKLISLMGDMGDAGVVHACSWALRQLLSKCSIADKDLKHRVRQQCDEIQDLYVSQAQAHYESTVILEMIHA